MQQTRTSPRIRAAVSNASFAVIALVLMVGSACTVKPSPRAAAENKTDPKRATSGGQNAVEAAQTGSGPGINLNCIYDRLQNPPESFHYVYKKTASDGFNVDQEADITPQTIDGFRGLSGGSQQPIHAMRSDPQSWQSALAGLTGVSGMAGTVSTFNHNAAMQQETDGGQVNGYQTIHYSIDTARWDATTRQMLGGFALGPGGFDRGDAWVMADGCPVKLVLDDEMHKKDGSLLDKVHYEEAMVKK